MKEVENYADGVKHLLVLGNKCDLEDERQVDKSEAEV